MKQQRWNSVRATSEARRHGSNIMSIRRDNDRRKAYTLVEMLIASVLVAALMSVVWGMMSMYNGYLTAGQTQAVERQLTRSVLQLLEDDFQNVAVADTNPRITPAVISEETAPMQNTLSTESTLGDPLSEVAIAAEEPLMLAELGASGISESPGKISLIGNSSSIRLSIERKLPIQGNPPLASENGDAQQPSTSAAPAFAQPPGESEAASVEGVSPKVEEFETVIWQFQPPGQMAGGTQSMRAGLYRIQTESLALQAAMQQQETLLEQSGPQDDSSVDRTTLETLLYPPTGAREQTANAASSAADSTSAAETAPQGLKFDLIPEVVGCRIEYFSGSAWMSTWNSDQQQGLPVAVRIRLRFVNAANLEKLQQVFGPESTSDSPLDATVNDGRSAVPSETVSNRSSATDPLDSATADLRPDAAAGRCCGDAGEWFTQTFTRTARCILRHIFWKRRTQARSSCLRSMPGSGALSEFQCRPHVSALPAEWRSRNYSCEGKDAQQSQRSRADRCAGSGDDGRFGGVRFSVGDVDGV